MIGILWKFLCAENIANCTKICVKSPIFNTAICIQAQTANIFARLFTFETGRLPRLQSMALFAEISGAESLGEIGAGA